ncbi:MAG: peptidase S9 family protein [Lysobacterales bacterium]|jgi:dipeptidyl aminopeptidase/acylaminoacyl peptidase|nr:MAG: peptidase S9 family protein [Xanthomonadales bacterium]
MSARRVAGGILALALLLPPLLAAEPILRREIGAVVLEDVPEVPPSWRERLMRYQNVRQAQFQDWLPDGGMLILTRFGDSNQVHRVRFAEGAREQLTFLDEPVYAARALEDGFLFVTDRGGSEFFQIYRFHEPGGRIELLTDGRSRHSPPVLSWDGRRIAFVGTGRNGRDFDVYEGPLAGPFERVFESEGTWQVFDYSPDGRYLLILNRISINESEPFLFDLEARKLFRLAPEGRKAAHDLLRFAPDGRSIYYVSNADGEFRTLRRLELASGREQPLSASIPWDVTAFDLSRDGRRLAFVVNEEGFSRLHVLDLRSGREHRLPSIPDGVISVLRFSPDGKKLGFGLSAARIPGDVFALEFGARIKLARWTRSETAGLDASRFAEARLIRYPSFDEEAPGRRRLIPTFYYLPEGPGPHPVLIQIHGGPEAQSLPNFNAIRQFWIDELGLAVFTPNVRGSSGYGKTYLDLDNGRLREDAVRDIGALLDWIASQPDLFDASRIGVIGGSYGGYMVLASLIHFPERIRAGVDIVGISHFVTFLESTQEYRRDARRVEYGDERDPEMRAFLHAISPLTRAHEIRAPLLIAQGQNDPRVPVSESEQMVRRIREQGGTVWYFLARDEGHGFQKKRNRDLFETVTALFLERKLLGRTKQSEEGP